MKQKLFTLHYKQLQGGEATGEPEILTDHKLVDLTKEELDYMTYIMENADFGCNFHWLRTEEQ